MEEKYIVEEGTFSKEFDEIYPISEETNDFYYVVDNRFLFQIPKSTMMFDEKHWHLATIEDFDNKEKYKILNKILRELPKHTDYIIKKYSLKDLEDFCKDLGV